MPKVDQRIKRLWQDKLLILISLALAFLAWQRIHSTIGYETTLSDIPIELIAPDGWSLLNRSLDKVSITLRGSQQEIRLLNPDNLRVIIPLPEPNPQQEATIKLKETHLLNPSAARLIRFNPPLISVSFDQTIERLIPVKATFTGNLREGLEILQATCKPAAVRIRGPRKIVEKIEQIKTSPISLDRRPATFMETMTLAIPPENDLRSDIQRIDVTVDIAEQIRTRRFLNVPLRILNSPRKTQFINTVPETINITVSGAQRRIDRINAENITAYVHCEQLEAATTYDLPVQIDLPAGIILNEIEPSVVKVSITSEKE